MDTKDLELFLAVARNGSISKTADQLYMSQSTVTTRIQRLERILGYALFTRQPGGVVISPAGSRLIPLAEQLLTVETKMQDLERETVGSLRIMSGRAFASTDVPSCLAAMLRAQPIRFQVQMGLYEEMLDALVSEQVDFCFLGEPIFHPRVKHVLLPDDHIDLIVAKKHPFAHDFPGLHAIRGESLVAFSQETAPFRRRIMTLLAKENLYPEIQMELDSLDGIKAMVAYGLGISFLPRRALSDAEAKGIAVIPVNRPGWTRPTQLCYPEGLLGTPLTEAFIHVVKAHYAREGWR